MVVAVESKQPSLRGVHHDPGNQKQVKVTMEAKAEWGKYIILADRSDLISEDIFAPTSTSLSEKKTFFKKILCL